MSFKTTTMLQILLWCSLSGMNYYPGYNPSLYVPHTPQQTTSLGYMPGPDGFFRPVAITVTPLVSQQTLLCDNLYQLAIAQHEVADEISPCMQAFVRCAPHEVASILLTPKGALAQNLVQHALQNWHIRMASTLLLIADRFSGTVIGLHNSRGDNLCHVALYVLRTCIDNPIVLDKFEPLCQFIDSWIIPFLRVQGDYSSITALFHELFAENKDVLERFSYAFDMDVAASDSEEDDENNETKMPPLEKLSLAVKSNEVSEPVNYLPTHNHDEVHVPLDPGHDIEEEHELVNQKLVPQEGATITATNNTSEQQSSSLIAPSVMLDTIEEEDNVEQQHQTTAQAALTSPITTAITHTPEKVELAFGKKKKEKNKKPTSAPQQKQPVAVVVKKTPENNKKTQQSGPKIATPLESEQKQTKHQKKNEKPAAAKQSPQPQVSEAAPQEHPVIKALLEALLDGPQRIPGLLKTHKKALATIKSWPKLYKDCHPRHVALQKGNVDTLMLLEKYITHIVPSNNDITLLLALAATKKASQDAASLSILQELWRYWAWQISLPAEIIEAAQQVGLIVSQVVVAKKQQKLTRQLADQILYADDVELLKQYDFSHYCYNYQPYISFTDQREAFKYYGIMIHALKSSTPTPINIIRYLFGKMLEDGIDPYLSISAPGYEIDKRLLISLAFDTGRKDVMQPFAEDVFRSSSTDKWLMLVYALGEERNFIYRGLIEDFVSFHSQNNNDWYEALGAITELTPALPSSLFVFWILNSKGGAEAVLRLLNTGKISREYFTSELQCLANMLGIVVGQTQTEENQLLFAYFFLTVDKSVWFTITKATDTSAVAMTEEKYAKIYRDYKTLAAQIAEKYPRIPQVEKLREVAA